MASAGTHDRRGIERSQRKSPGAIKGLIGLVLVLGFLQAGMVAMAPKPDLPPRMADIPNMEAMQKARSPLRIALLNPLVGAGGSLGFAVATGVVAASHPPR